MAPRTPWYLSGSQIHWTPWNLNSISQVQTRPVPVLRISNSTPAWYIEACGQTRLRHIIGCTHKSLIKTLSYCSSKWWHQQAKVSAWVQACKSLHMYTNTSVRVWLSRGIFWCGLWVWPLKRHRYHVPTIYSLHMSILYDQGTLNSVPSLCVELEF